ncbi:MAG: hypothetical protein A3J38_06945 [Gammaproteobacteria bacterium RIFCSPHIGHO2_12_FULL_45_9]|nr:MAG: hypothetical protein A3J38_06945 [Gammaproteobacteria bacterium RIFCSPHIGHO2_12_FULL_45_9]
MKESLFVTGPVGRLEVLMEQPEGMDVPSRIALICHPHPLYGGTMQNKVVTTLARAFLAEGLLAIRFNYRGVGLSEGSYGDFVGESADLKAMVAWIQETYPAVPRVLAGFSFGGRLALEQVYADPTAVCGLVTVSPAVHVAAVRAFHIAVPWLLIQGDADEVVPYEAVAEVAHASEPQPEFAVLAGATHFFHGRLLDVERVVREWVIGHLD